MFIPLTLPMVLQALHFHDIACGMQSGEEGCRVWIGDGPVIRATETFEREEFEDIAPWLIAQAQKLYPNAGSLH